MNIQLYIPEYENELNKFLESSQDSTFYHRIEWINIIKNSFSHRSYYLIVLADNEIKGVLPLIHIKSLLFGSMLCSMPFLNYAGIIADNKNIEKCLINESIKIKKEVKAKYIELRNKKKSSFDLTGKTHKISMMVELENNPENLWNRFSSKHRTNIRKSINSNLKFEVGHLNLLDDFYTIISKGWRNHGTPIYKKDFFLNILESFQHDVEICAVRHEEKIIAVAFNGLFKDTIEGMWTYALSEYNHLQPNYFLYWKMIENVCERGFKKFHLGRSTVDSSAVFFKKKWNAIPVQLYWEYILDDSQNIPELNVDNPKYKLFINSWRKMPLKLTQLVGPFFAKNIP